MSAISISDLWYRCNLQYQVTIISMCLTSHTSSPPSFPINSTTYRQLSLLPPLAHSSYRTAIVLRVSQGTPPILLCWTLRHRLQQTNQQPPRRLYLPSLPRIWSTGWNFICLLKYNIYFRNYETTLLSFLSDDARFVVCDSSGAEGCERVNTR